jgi:hypothetical protein
MAWDFRTDEAFEPELVWIRQFVREEIEPLDLVKSQMSRQSFAAAIAPMKQQVKERGLWVAHLDPELGGQGLAVDGWPSEHIPTRRAAVEAHFARYLDLATENA